jgi:hypothetical protein
MKRIGEVAMMMDIKMDSKTHLIAIEIQNVMNTAVRTELGLVQVVNQ